MNKTTPKKSSRFLSRRPLIIAGVIVLAATLIVYGILAFRHVNEQASTSLRQTRSTVQAALKQLNSDLRVSDSRKQITAVNTFAARVDEAKKLPCGTVRSTIFYGALRDRPECGALTDNLEKLKTQLARSERFLEDQNRMITALGPVEKPQKTYDASISAWRRAVDQLDKLQVAKDTEAVKVKLVDIANATYESWRALKAADDKQNKAAFTEAQKGLKEHHKRLSAIQADLSNTARTIQGDINKALDRLKL